MAWKKPKTDWKSTDFFNASDYNRIIGNLKFLKTYIDKMYPDVSFFDLGANKTYTSYIYASEINRIQDEIDNINVYDLDVGKKVTYAGNKRTPTYAEFNRIESAILRLHDMMIAQHDALPRLAFTLGGGKGIKI